MKKITLLLLAIISITSAAFSQGMTTEEFMKKYYEKTGLDKFKDIKTITVEGEMQILADLYPFRLHFKAPDKYRYKERFKNDYAYKIINGSDMKAITKGGRLIDLNPMEIDIIHDIINFMEGFISQYKQNDFKIEYIGLDTLHKTSPNQGRPQNPNMKPQDIKIDPLNLITVYKIKVTTPQEKDFIMKLDTASMDILWSSGNPFIFADIAPLKFNYYEKVDGFSFPFHYNLLSDYMPMTFRISIIKLNEEMPDSYFKLDSKENEVLDDTIINENQVPSKDSIKVKKQIKQKKVKK